MGGRVFLSGMRTIELHKTGNKQLSITRNKDAEFTSDAIKIRAEILLVVNGSRKAIMLLM